MQKKMVYIFLDNLLSARFYGPYIWKLKNVLAVYAFLARYYKIYMDIHLHITTN